MRNNPILSKLSADVTSREAYTMFKTGQIEAGEYNRILADCRMLDKQARQVLAIYVPMRRERGGSYDSRKL